MGQGTPPATKSVPNCFEHNESIACQDTPPTMKSIPNRFERNEAVTCQGTPSL